MSMENEYPMDLKIEPLPHFKKFDDSAEARGYVSNSLSQVKHLKSFSFTRWEVEKV